MGTTSARRATSSQLRWPFLVKTKRTLFFSIASIRKQWSTHKKNNGKYSKLLFVDNQNLISTLERLKFSCFCELVFFFAKTYQATCTKSEISKSSHTIDWGERKDLHKIASSSFRSDRRCFRTLLRQIRERKEFGFVRWYEIMKK